MTRLPAEKDLIIEYDAFSWRLQRTVDGLDAPLVSAEPASSLRLDPTFATRRALPPELAKSDLVEIVVGWSEPDTSWHMGLILAPELAAQRANRWVGLAQWIDPYREYETRMATQAAGETLANLIGVPLRVIAPQEQGAVSPEPAEPAALKLPEPPLKFGTWNLTQDGTRMIVQRSGAWRRGRLFRVIWYLLWSAAFIIVSIASLTIELRLPSTGILLPDPRVLPYLGIFAGGIIFLLFLKVLIEYSTQPSRFEIDTQTQQVTAFVGRRRRWSLRASDVHAVIVSEVVRAKRDLRAVQYGEINLQRDSRHFQHLVQLDTELDARRVPGSSGAVTEEMAPLHRITSDLQGVAALIGQALGGRPVILDQRRN
jgi:hypothetical protein